MSSQLVERLEVAVPGAELVAVVYVAPATSLHAIAVVQHDMASSSEDVDVQDIATGLAEMGCLTIAIDAWFHGNRLPKRISLREWSGPKIGDEIVRRYPQDVGVTMATVSSRFGNRIPSRSVFVGLGAASTWGLSAMASQALFTLGLLCWPIATTPRQRQQLVSLASRCTAERITVVADGEAMPWEAAKDVAMAAPAALLTRCDREQGVIPVVVREVGRLLGHL